jgi:hypothetical protein
MVLRAMLTARVTAARYFSDEGRYVAVARKRDSLFGGSIVMTHYEALSNRLLPDIEQMHTGMRSFTFSRPRANEVLRIAVELMPVNSLEQLGSVPRSVREQWQQNTLDTYKLKNRDKFGISIIAMLLLGALVNYAIRALLDWWFRGPEYAAQIKDARSELMG